MASGEITVRFSDYRPCIVNGRKAMFHRLADRAHTVAESILRGGAPAGQHWSVVAVVEYEDGTMHECYPYEVRFLDSRGLFAQYDFSEEVNADETAGGN